MDSLKHPGTILAGIDLVGLISVSIYFQKQITETQREIDELKKTDSNIENVKKQFENIHKKLNELSTHTSQHIDVLNAHSNLIQNIHNRVNQCHVNQEIIINALRKRGILTEGDNNFSQESTNMLVYKDDENDTMESKLSNRATTFDSQ